MKLIRNKLALTPYENRSVIIVNIESQKSLAFDKIVEEAHELFNAKTDQEIILELADLQDAIANFKKLHNISEEVLTQASKDKLENRGSFDGGFALL